MTSAIRIDAPARLPLAQPDRACEHLLLDGRLVEADDATFLLLEARRILEAGGILTLAPEPDLDEAALRRLTGLVGFLPLEDDGAGKAGGCRFVKPDRTASASPPVSIAIPAYSPRFFEECLASAIAQTYPNLEILVCDDSQGGEIEAITARLAERRPVRYRRNEPRLGARGNYAKGVDLAQGEFIKFLNDDDILEAHCVERLMEAFRLAPDISLATSYRARIDEQGRRLPDQPATRPIAARDVILHGPALANVMLMAGLNMVGEPSTAMFRKADMPEGSAGRFHFDGVVGKGVIDMTMWSSLLLKGDAVYFSEALSRFRIHAGQQQADPAIQQMGVQGIRDLQAAWLRLGLHTHFNRREFQARPFPPQSAVPAVPAGATPRLWRYC